MQQRLGGLKVRGIEALGEPSVCFGKHLARFVVPTLLLVEARQTCSRSELPRFAQLVPRCSNRSTKVIFGISICDLVRNASSPLRRCNSAFWQSSSLLSAMA